MNNIEVLNSQRVHFRLCIAAEVPQPVSTLRVLSAEGAATDGSTASPSSYFKQKHPCQGEEKNKT